MNMRKIITLIGLLSFFAFTSAQKRYMSEYALTNINSSVGVGELSFIDPYLSSLKYSGFGINLETTSSRYFNTDIRNLVSYGKVSGTYALTYNPAVTASAMFLAANGGWGALYENRSLRNFKFLCGGNIDIDFIFKHTSRNVNNPVSFDLAADLNAMLGGEFFIPTKRRVMKLKADIEFPIIGEMFAPLPGLTLYEISISKNIKQAMHFTHLQNKQAFKVQFAFDVPFKYSTWSYGVRLHQMNYKLAGHQYQQQELTVFVGIVYDYILFSGRKNSNPRGFVSPGEHFYKRYI